MAEVDSAARRLPGVGPMAYENWKAALQKQPKRLGIEVPLFSDARFTGEIAEGIGPYQLLNAIAGMSPPRHAPALVLRYWIYSNDLQSDSMDKTSVDRYHGGDLDDELAALASLCMGVRLKAGGETRRFGGRTTDPLGHPYSFAANKDPGLPQVGLNPVLPRCRGERCLNTSCSQLATFNTLSPEAANALIRSARSYQEALWVAESDPHLSWLLLVSAAETTASFWRAEEATPLERMQAARPELVRMLRKEGDEDWLEEVAGQLAPYMGATKTFTDFLLAFLPDPPLPRPHLLQHPWEPKAIRDSLRAVYNWRSRALHGGIPFPLPMCEPPVVCGVIAERPGGLACAGGGGVWRADDTPMLLHLFEHLVRGALMRWWAKLVPGPIPDRVGTGAEPEASR